MNLGRFLILSLLFLWSFSTHAQEAEKITIQPLDTAKVTIDPLSPSKAAFYSALVPGLGQIYNKKYWKLPIVYGGLAIGIYSYSWNNNKYHEYRDEYKRRLDGTSQGTAHPTYGGLSDDGLLRAQKYHQRNRDLSALISAGIYILNIIDANVDAHLMQFNVNDNLSVAPDIRQNQIDYKFNSGVKLTFNF